MFRKKNEKQKNIKILPKLAKISMGRCWAFRGAPDFKYRSFWLETWKQTVAAMMEDEAEQGIEPEVSEAGPKAKAKRKAKASPKKRSAPKPRAAPKKVDPLALGDWADVILQQAGEEEDEISAEEDVIEPQAKKRMRFELGFDEDGNALPDNDASPYTPKQIYVLRKVIGTDQEKAKQFDALMAAKNKKDLRIFVNSLVPKNASFGWGLSSGSSSSTIQLVRDRTEDRTRRSQAHGVTYTKRCSDTHDVKISENLRGAHSWEAGDTDEVEELAVYLKDPTAMLATSDKPKEKKTHVPFVPATEETMKLLRQAYDNMNLAVFHVKQKAREVGQRSESCNDFLSDVLTLSVKVSKAITDLDGLFCSVSSLTDAVVRDTLRRHTELSTSFLNKGSDLSSILVHLKKSEKKGDQKPDAGGKRASRCAHADQ